ncbi:hypothetical protein XENTR_v10012608 [Xenopus tropicalis]|nr:hypothetical protein XENTR_v10012608 [Xenopus tropicalis]
MSGSQLLVNQILTCDSAVMASVNFQYAATVVSDGGSPPLTIPLQMWREQQRRLKSHHQSSHQTRIRRDIAPLSPLSLMWREQQRRLKSHHQSSYQTRIRKDIAPLSPLSLVPFVLQKLQQQYKQLMAVMANRVWSCRRVTYFN